MVTEAGETLLWGPVERAHRLWLDADRPGWERLGLTVGPDGDNTVWLDRPNNVLHTSPSDVRLPGRAPSPLRPAQSMR